VVATILFIGSAGTRDDKYLAALEKQYDVVAARSGRRGLHLGKGHRFEAVILDAVSMRTPGDRVCRMLKEILKSTPVIHIHPGPRSHADSPADVVLFQPLSARRLVNSLEQLLYNDDEEVLDYGPFRMNVPRRVLIAYGKETQLTPKLALLVETFLRNPGQTMDRKTLMERVWETDYLGDTRTLDVHIRWIRKIMENGGKQPRYLKTVRGVGYCLEVTEPG
jgi:DNA-binding response OmpR family regulator